MKTLLEKAKETGHRKQAGGDITEEIIELALAWAKGEIGLKQASEALGYTNTGNVYVIFARALKKHLNK